jgi:penicillin amidase/acyl-homoserine-lactone acylase
VAWYEVHLESGEGWRMHGGLFPGSPIATIGATPNLAWGVTVNQPDLVDEFVLTTDAAHPDHYQLDGAWVPFETRSITLKVPLIGSLYWPLTQTVRSTVHGPVLETDHGLYALRFAGHKEIRQPEQWYAMNRATDLEGWQAAMDLNAIASFNFVYGDRAGNIAFVHNSRSPLRAPGWDWKKRLPGDRSDLIWEQTQSFRANPQVLNPASGFVLSANQSPFAVTAEGDNPDPTAYPPELGLPTRMTNRADRGLELFASLPKVSAEAFEAIKFDKAYAAHSRSMAYVDSAQALDAEAGSLLAKAKAVLAAWDRNTDLDNPGAALGVCVLSEEWLAERAPRAPAPIEEQVLTCAEKLQAHFGRLDPPWGSVNRLRRGAIDIPIAGGPDVLRAIYGREQTNDGRLTAVAGDGLMIFAEWAADGTPRLRTRHNFGSASTRPRSPHYADQAEAFAGETLRTVTWNRAVLEAQTTARTRLTATP